MLRLRRKTQMDKTRETLREVLSYADGVVRDEALRADILSAIGHGSKAGDRVKKNFDADGIAARLSHDKKLRKEVRAALDDLDTAGGRLRPRRRRRHRVRNVTLIAMSAGAAAAIAKNARRWFAPEPAAPASP